MLNLSEKIQVALTSGKVWVLIMMLIGSLLVIVYKFQNSIYVYEGPAYKPNFHPFLQSTSMFLGQMISLPLFYFFKKRNRQSYLQKQQIALKKGKKLNMNRFYFFIPAFFDLLTSTMQFVAFNFISTSAYQMMKGGSIITTFLFSVTFLKQPVIRKQLVGSILAFIGIFIVGLANTVFTEGASSGDGNFMEVIGYILMISSLFSSGFTLVVQQKLLTAYHIEPLQVVGFQGLFGFIMCSLMLPILCHMPCHFGADACVFSRQGFSYIQGFQVYFDELAADSTLLILTLLTIFGIFLYNVAGVTVTKYINALARAVADMTKSLFVWILGLFVTISLGSTYPNFKWQKLQANVIILQSVGFITMAIGTFIYNDIIKIKILEEKKKDQLEKQQIQVAQQKLMQTQQKIN